MANFLSNTIVSKESSNNAFITANPMSGLLISNNNSSTSGIGQCKAIIGYDNKIPSSSYSGQNQDSMYPFENCLDYRDNTQYSPAIESGTIEITISQQELFTVDYFGIAIHNGFSSGLSGSIQMQSLETGEYVNIAEFAPYGINKTICGYFGEHEAYKFRVVLNFTSKLFIGALYVGKAWNLERQPDIGLKPASLNNVDKVVSFDDNNGQFTIGRVERVGFDTSADFSLVPMPGDNGIRANWPSFQEHCKLSRPFFFKWSTLNSDNTFGQYKSPSSMPDMTYTTSFHGTVPIRMRGRD